MGLRLWLCVLTMSLPARAQPFAWAAGRGVYWVSGNRLHLFTRDGRYVRSTPAFAGTFTLTRGQIEVENAFEIASFDLQLRQKSVCRLEDGWRLDAGDLVFTRVGGLPDQYGRLDRRTCTVHPYGERFSALVGFAGTFVFSPSRRRVAIDRDGSTMVGERTVNVYTYPTLEPVRTELHSQGSAKFGADSLGGVGDDGALTWVPAVRPCYGLDGEAMQADGDVYVSPAGVWRIDRLSCPSLEVQEQDDQLLAPLSFAPGAQLVLAQPGLALLAAGPRVFRVSFPKTKRGFDYAKPSVDELVTAADAEPVKGAVAGAGLVLVLSDSRAWLVSGAQLEPLRVP